MSTTECPDNPNQEQDKCAVAKPAKTPPASLDLLVEKRIIESITLRFPDRPGNLLAKIVSNQCGVAFVRANWYEEVACKSAILKDQRITCSEFLRISSNKDGYVVEVATQREQPVFGRTI